MASITIRRLPENTKRRLRMRAARNGRSMEQEARELLEAGLARTDAEPENLGEAIHRRFAPLGGVDLKIPPAAVPSAKSDSSDNSSDRGNRDSGHERGFRTDAPVALGGRDGVVIAKAGGRPFLRDHRDHGRNPLRSRTSSPGEAP